MSYLDANLPSSKQFAQAVQTGFKDFFQIVMKEQVETEILREEDLKIEDYQQIIQTKVFLRNSKIDSVISFYFGAEVLKSIGRKMMDQEVELNSPECQDLANEIVNVLLGRFKQSLAASQFVLHLQKIEVEYLPQVSLASDLKNSEFEANHVYWFGIRSAQGNMMLKWALQSMPVLEENQFDNWHVLLVDDSMASRAYTQKLLKRIGFKSIDEADGYRSAIKKIESSVTQEKLYNLVISDWRMLPFSGTQFKKRLNEMPQYKGTRFVLITAETDRLPLQEAKEANIQHILYKPFDVDLLKLTLLRVIQTDQEVAA